MVESFCTVLGERPFICNLSVSETAEFNTGSWRSPRKLKVDLSLLLSSGMTYCSTRSRTSWRCSGLVRQMRYARTQKDAAMALVYTGQ